ncbi:MAG: DEAD/DEAH box helicase family protein [Candidatus Margulisbacteria bacterium]|jgi:type III restriction enzyme|nr:DEAD/DEAH box helicase family protein [Candidatus Margulisiibacteriota bacterium]
MPEPQTLAQDLTSYCALGGVLPDLPSIIQNNLNPSFELRPYQIEAFRRLVYLLNNPHLRQKPAQLLFHMATGSGKTLIMAGAILYLYALGYRNFLFFVNSANIINKTKDNFLNSQSIKYLFNEIIAVLDKKITVREIDNFQHGHNEDINIIFSTIQGLHSRLNTPRENTVTYEDFADQKIALISDEAHHINADTKNKKQSAEELEEIVSWEGTVSRIFRQNPDNILLEFTATAGLDAERSVWDKYFDKIIFDYPLKKFREDGYSKEVKVLQADLKPLDRALQALLLNQYRRKIFEKNKLLIKPALLFKSKTIADSRSFYGEFCAKIAGLKAADLERFNAADNPIVSKIFAYLKENKISAADLAAELKNDFAPEKCIVVNSQEESEAKQIAVNTLEDPRNEYRAIFAVDKLNEGWDVLNLFDIVRLYNTRDAKQGKPGRTTIREAQLIGRGARYCPFVLTDRAAKYSRKFDQDAENELRVCEELYYHSEHNPDYIAELNKALEEIGIKARTKKEIPLRLKEDFKASEFYQRGFIFLNERRKYDRAQIKSLPTASLAAAHKIKLRTGRIGADALFDNALKDHLLKLQTVNETRQKDYFLLDFGLSVIRKALHRLPFYDFNNLQAFLPSVRSLRDFITNKNFLGGVRLEVTGGAQAENLTPRQKLDIAVEVLAKISADIISNKIEYQGTKEFKPAAVKSCFKDKKLEINVPEDSDQERGVGQSVTPNPQYRLDLSNKDWYAFTDNYGTSEEKALVKFINKTYETLKSKYDIIYLLRNERFFQLYNFADGRPFEPDFVLFLARQNAGESLHYQIFIEPKGNQLLEKDKWKEEYLRSLKENTRIQQVWRNKKYIVWGLPFFNEKYRELSFPEAFAETVK